VSVTFTRSSWFSIKKNWDRPAIFDGELASRVRNDSKFEEIFHAVQGSCLDHPMTDPVTCYGIFDNRTHIRLKDHLPGECPECEYGDP